MTMLQFASFDTSFWKVPSFDPKDSNIPTSTLQASSSNLPHRSLLKIPKKIWPTGSTGKKKKPEYLFLLENATKPWSWVFFGIRSHSIFDRIYETYPSQGPPEISNDFPPRGNIQAATFKPLAPPQFLTVLISWLLNREKESQKKNVNNPKSEVKYAEKTWVFKTCLRRFWDFTIFSNVYEMYNAKKPSGWNRNVDCFLYVFCMFFVCFFAPRCSTSSPTSLLFVVSGAVRLATSGPKPSNDPPEGSRGEGQLVFSRKAAPPSAPSPGCSGSHWSQDPTRIENRLDLTVHWVYFQQTCVKRSWKWIKLPNLWNYVELRVISNAKKNLSSKHCNCSKAQPRWPILRPDCELSDPPRPHHQVPSPPQPLAWQANKPKLQCPQCPGETARKR